ncbi:MAG: BA14K family protein [Pseudomonadota bacterium]
MVFQSLRRPAIWSSLAAAFAFCLPTGTASAATHAGPTALTITPTFAATTGANTPSASLDGLVEVAQNRARRVRRLRRNARRARVRNLRRGARNRGFRRGRIHRPYRGRYYNDPSAVVGGIIGLAAGAIAAGALYSPPPPRVVYRNAPQPYSGEWYRRCSYKYRSFRASDGTFLGYDGIRRRCRLP